MTSELVRVGICKAVQACIAGLIYKKEWGKTEQLF